MKAATAFYPLPIAINCSAVRPMRRRKITGTRDKNSNNRMKTTPIPTLGSTADSSSSNDSDCLCKSLCSRLLHGPLPVSPGVAQPIDPVAVAAEVANVLRVDVGFGLSMDTRPKSRTETIGVGAGDSVSVSRQQPGTRWGR